MNFQEEPSFLGKGWSYPVSFMHNGKTVGTSTGEQNIQDSLEILLSTELSERLMHPYFGCGLKRFIYDEINADLISKIKDIVSNAILIYESRIDLVNVKVHLDPGTYGLLIININFVIRSTNTRSNKVYPFYLTEASNL